MRRVAGRFVWWALLTYWQTRRGLAWLFASMRECGRELALGHPFTGGIPGMVGAGHRMYFGSRTHTPSPLRSLP
jgi:hypothetical protein